MRTSTFALLALLALLGCKKDPMATSETRGSSAPTSATPSSAGAVVTTARASSETNEPAREARLARPKEIVLAPVKVFEGSADLLAIDNGVVACTPECELDPARGSIQVWFVTRGRTVETPALQPWSTGIDTRVRYTFYGAWPEDAYATVWQATGRSGRAIDVKYDGALWQKAKESQIKALPREDPPPPELFAELGLEDARLDQIEVAWGGDAPTIVFDDDRLGTLHEGGKKRPVRALVGRDVRSLYRLENGYTFVSEGQTVNVLDRAGEAVPIRIEGEGLPAKLDDVRWMHVYPLVVGKELWIQAVTKERTVVLAAPPGLFTTLHLRRVAMDPAVALMNGRLPWGVDWKPAPVPRTSAAPAGGGAPAP